MSHFKSFLYVSVTCRADLFLGNLTKRYEITKDFVLWQRQTVQVDFPSPTVKAVFTWFNQKRLIFFFFPFVFSVDQSEKLFFDERGGTMDSRLFNFRQRDELNNQS